MQDVVLLCIIDYYRVIIDYTTLFYACIQVLYVIFDM